MTSITTRKSIFNSEERALIRPFQATYMAAKDSNERKDIAITSILPCLIQKWEAELPPGESIDIEMASKVYRDLLNPVHCSFKWTEYSELD